MEMYFFIITLKKTQKKMYFSIGLTNNQTNAVWDTHLCQIKKKSGASLI